MPLLTLPGACFVIAFLAWFLATIFAVYWALLNLAQKVVDDVRDTILQIRFHDWSRDPNGASLDWTTIKEKVINIKKSDKYVYAFNIQLATKFAKRNIALFSGIGSSFAALGEVLILICR